MAESRAVIFGLGVAASLACALALAGVGTIGIFGYMPLAPVVTESSNKVVFHILMTTVTISLIIALFTTCRSVSNNIIAFKVVAKSGKNVGRCIAASSALAAFKTCFGTGGLFFNNGVFKIMATCGTGIRNIFTYFAASVTRSGSCAVLKAAGVIIGMIFCSALLIIFIFVNMVKSALFAVKNKDMTFKGF